MTIEDWNRRAADLRMKMMQAAIDALPADCEAWKMRAIDGMTTGIDAWHCQRDGKAAVYVVAACNGIDVGAAWSDDLRRAAENACGNLIDRICAGKNDVMERCAAGGLLDAALAQHVGSGGA